MDLLQALVLALVQGITEFLPISSSAHLILPAQLFGWPDQGLAFDVAVHLGSLVAVLVVLREDVFAMIRGALRWPTSREVDGHFRLGLLLVLATVPVVIVGPLLKDQVETTLRSVEVIALATIGFGLLLWFADYRADYRADSRADIRADHQADPGAEPQAPLSSTTTQDPTPIEIDARSALLIGLAQCLALIPGTSRSGITMTAGLLVGLSREDCARFSFLLSIPTIAGAAVLSLADLLSETTPVPWSDLATGFVAAAVSAWACIRLFLALVERIGFLPFVLYRLALGAALFLLVL